jgi:hypothetical protein
MTTINPETILAGLRTLNTEAYDYKIPEQILTEHANNIAHTLGGELHKDLARPVQQVMIERERLIYWLIQAASHLEYPDDLIVTNEHRALREGIRCCLKELNHPIDGWRAKRLIESGEPKL